MLSSRTSLAKQTQRMQNDATCLCQQAESYLEQAEMTCEATARALDINVVGQAFLVKECVEHVQ